MLLQALHVHNCLAISMGNMGGLASTCRSWILTLGSGLAMDGVGASWWSPAVRASAKTRPLGTNTVTVFCHCWSLFPLCRTQPHLKCPSVLIPTHWEMLRAAGGDSSSWEELFPAGVTDWEVWGSSLAAQDFFCPRFSSSYVQCSSSSKSHHGRASVCRSLFLGFNMGHFSQYLSSLGAQGHINSNLLVVVVVVLDQAIINSLSSYRCQIWQGFSLLVSLPWVWFYYMLLYLNLEGRKLITAWT